MKKGDTGKGVSSAAAVAMATATAENDDDDNDSEEDDDGWWVIKRRVHEKVQPRIRCRDGFEMSVQASRDHYCVPRDDAGPYTHVEVGYTSEWEDLLIPHRDRSAPDICGTRPILCVNVSAQTV